MASTLSKAEKERQKLVQDKCQHYLMELLKDDDNKYCVDCDAKGPRWASWNLGVFLCIRCAGIHRNLGVHISKVKSVNLDAWTPEQVGYLQQMGNSKARAVYEANLPDNFRRPQTDSSLEAFIRAKYEHKKYIAKEWVQPPTPPAAFDVEEERKKEKEKKRQKATAIIRNSLTSSDIQTNPVPRPHSNPTGNTISADKVPKEKTTTTKTSSNGESDLLGLSFDTTPTQISRPSGTEEDPFDAFVSASGNDSTEVSPTKGSDIKFADEESDFFNQKVPEKKLDKDSILKMFDSSVPTPANPLFGVATTPSLFPGQVPVISGHGLYQNNISNSGMNILPPATGATNPFLTGTPTNNQNHVKQPNSNLFQVQQQLGSLNINPISGVPGWMSVPETVAMPLVSKPTSSLDSINPFASAGIGALSTSGQVSAKSPSALFPDFAQLSTLTNDSSSPATTAATNTSGGTGINWAFPSSVGAVPASTSTIPSSDLWQ